VSFQLRVSALPTDVIASGLLLKTPCAADAYTEGLSKKEQRFGNSGTLAQEVQSGFIYQRGLLPTVKTTDSHKQRSLDENGQNTSHTTGTKYGLHLTQLAEARMLPTPCAFDYKTPRSPEAWERAKEKHGDALQDTLRQRAGQGSQLNPRFVAEMMGFPVNWTESAFQSGEPNQSKPTETP
jgi:hypothetical protein